jgi:hypothetical protein
VETLTFASTAEFMRWAQRIAKYKYQNYDRVPVGNPTWTYGNGHIAQTEWGERGGTVVSNLSYMVSIANGGLDQQWDKRLVDDIDAREGVVITIRWTE